MKKLEFKMPTFMPGPVKKEMLLCLRDAAIDEQNIRYHEYSDGIITGCGLIEEDMNIGIINGIVKFGGRLYKLSEKTLLPYEPTDSWTVMKISFNPETEHREYIHFTADLILDNSAEITSNELEVGRFKLKKGSRLRTSYKDFSDMATEYDTVNLIYVRQSARGVSTLNPEITTHFAREAYPFLKDNALDCSFCAACLSEGRSIGRELITRYVCNRLNKEYRDMSNAELHKALSEILDLIRGRGYLKKGFSNDDKIMIIN